MVIKYLLLAFIALICQCVNALSAEWLDCDEAGSIYDVCQCNIRKNTQYLSANINCNYIQTAARIALENCVNISYCLDAYGYDDNYCPKAWFNYDTTSCRDACLKELKNLLPIIVHLCAYILI